MRKFFSILVVAFSATLVFAAQPAVPVSKYVSNSGATPIVKSVLNSDQLLISGYSITLPYPVEDIEEAVIRRLYREGLEGSLRKSTYVFKNIKYNLLWPRNFDLYINFMGSPTTGTINLILSQGYDNFIIPSADTVTTNKVFKWMTQLDLDVQNYRYNETMDIHLDEQRNIQKDLNKLEKQRASLEKKIAKISNKQKKLEVSRTVPVGGNPVDPKKVAKEEEKAMKLQREKVSLTTDLEAVNKKISEVNGDLSAKNAVILELKQNKPLKND